MNVTIKTNGTEMYLGRAGATRRSLEQDEDFHNRLLPHPFPRLLCSPRDGPKLSSGDEARRLNWPLTQRLAS